MIEILLATYNGAKYVGQQIDSLLSQSFTEWRLLVRDDGSLDDTVAIVEEYVRRYPGKIELVEDDEARGGAKANFVNLMRRARAEYVMFCDQDDVWLGDKIEKTLRVITAQEQAVGKATPIGAFTDLAVVSEDLQPIARSMWQYNRTSPRLARSARALAVRNCVTGCTLMINKAALAVSVPVPCEAVMHDWWIALKILERHGHLLPLHEQTVLYRQHARNVVGARPQNGAFYVRRITDFRSTWNEQKRAFRMARSAGVIRTPLMFGLAKAWVLADAAIRG